MSAQVYALVDPVTFGIRYVGVTTVGMAERLKAHVKNSHSVGVKAWVSGLKESGLSPLPILLEKCGRRNHFAREARWISFVAACGHSLLNSEKIGRPPETGETRDQMVSVRFNEREWAVVQSLARKSGKSDTAYMRDRTLAES